MLMLAQDELKKSKFAEFETDAPDNIWHPEFKQEQLDLQKKQLQAMIVAIAPPESQQLYAPIHFKPIIICLKIIPSFNNTMLLFTHTCSSLLEYHQVRKVYFLGSSSRL